MSHLVYLGLGTNLGRRLANIQGAVKEIGALPHTEVARSSSVYETVPWGVAEQPPFLNAVVEAYTDLSPICLLRAVKELEACLGRTKTTRWGPRVIDIDILIYGDFRVHCEELEIPHPQICNRLFVLVPLAELFPDWECPVGDTVIEVAAALWDPTKINKTAYDLTIAC